MAIVYTDSVKKLYLAGRCSFSWWVSILLTALLWILPFFVAYWTNDLWKKSGQYDEVPRIQFDNNIVMMTEGARQSDMLIWSTYRDFNDALGYDDRVRPAAVKSSHNDTNDDGTADYINVRIRVPLKANEEVRRATLALFVSVSLHERIRLSMQSMVYIQASSPHAGAELHVTGDVYLRQVEPLNVRRTRSIYNQPLLPTTGITATTNTLFPPLLTADLARNESIVLKSTQLYWQSGVDEAFTVYVRLRVPLQPIRYVPAAGEALKFAWIQYLAIWAILYYIIDRSSRFCFRQQVFETRVYTEGQPKQHTF